MDLLTVDGYWLDWAELDRLDAKDPAGSLRRLRG